MRRNGGKRLGVAWLVAALVLAAGAVVPAATLAGGQGSKHKKPCSGTFDLSPATRPRALSGNPGASALSHFAVLTRPATAADRRGLRLVRAPAAGELRGIWRAYGRRLTYRGTSWELVVGLLRVPALPPARCLPPALRDKLPELRAAERKERREVQMCLFPARGVGAAQSLDCTPLSAVLDGAAVAEGSLTAQPVTLLAPDGVAAVKAVFRKRTVTAPVIDNLFRYKSPKGLLRAAMREENRLFKQLGNDPTPAKVKRFAKKYGHKLQAIFRRLQPTKVQWLDAGGAVIRTLRIPKLGSYNGVGVVGGSFATSTTTTSSSISVITTTSSVSTTSTVSATTATTAGG